MIFIFDIWAQFPWALWLLSSDWIWEGFPLHKTFWTRFINQWLDTLLGHVWSRSPKGNLGRAILVKTQREWINWVLSSRRVASYQLLSSNVNLFQFSWLKVFARALHGFRQHSRALILVWPLCIEWQSIWVQLSSTFDQGRLYLWILPWFII